MTVRAKPRIRVLVTGGTGQVGAELARAEWPEGFEVCCPPRSELDLSDEAAMRARLGRRCFGLIVNSSAYTAVDMAETEAATAWAVNTLAPAVLAAAAVASDIPIIQLSTDYVFDGRKKEAYAEDDRVVPLGVYGASKEAGERAVREGCSSHVILRTSWVISPHGRNFVRTMLRLGRARDATLRVVADQHGAPTAAADVARAVVAVARRLARGDGAFGTYHFASKGVTTWYEIAEAVFAVAERHGHAPPRLVPIATSDWPATARRPLNSRLDCSKIARDYALRQRSWRAAVEEVTLQCLLAERGGCLERPANEREQRDA